MIVVAGLSLKNLQPAVWDPRSPYYLRELRAVMVSYAEFPLHPSGPQKADRKPPMALSERRELAMRVGLHAYLGIPESLAIYLDNGALHFSALGVTTDARQYEEFVEAAIPDWRPVSQDFIPLPSMEPEEQRHCLARTMAVNRRHSGDGYAPVIHISSLLGEYLEELTDDELLAAKRAFEKGQVG